MQQADTNQGANEAANHRVRLQHSLLSVTIPELPVRQVERPGLLAFSVQPTPRADRTLKDTETDEKDHRHDEVSIPEVTEDPEGHRELVNPVQKDAPDNQQGDQNDDNKEHGQNHNDPCQQPLYHLVVPIQKRPLESHVLSFFSQPWIVPGLRVCLPKYSGKFSLTKLILF